MFAPGAQALQQCGAQAGFVGAAQRRGNRVAVGVQEAVLAIQPGGGPFHLAGGIAVRRGGQLRFACPGLRQHASGLADISFQAVAQAAREVQHRLGRGFVLAALQQRRIADPADFDAAEQIGLGAAQPIQPGGAELRGAEYLRIRLETDRGATAIVHRPGVQQLRGRLAAGIALLPQHAVARHLHLHRLGQGVHHRRPDPMQATRGLVRLAAELSPRVQRGEDHLQSAELLELGVRIDRDATAVIPHRQPVVLLQCDLDEAGMAGHRLVHGVVEGLGRQVVQGGFVGAANIHAGAAAHRLQALQDLDILGGVISAGRRSGGFGALAVAAGAEQIVHAVFRFARRTLAGAVESGQHERGAEAASPSLPELKRRGGTSSALCSKRHLARMHLKPHSHPRESGDLCRMGPRFRGDDDALWRLLHNAEQAVIARSEATKQSPP